MNESILIDIDNEVIKNINDKKLSGVNLNNTLGFNTNVTNIYNRVTKKSNALARISSFMRIHKRGMTM